MNQIFCSITWILGAGKSFKKLCFHPEQTIGFPSKLACCIMHCNEISFCNTSHGDLFRHISNLLWSLHSLCIVDHEYIKFFAERCCKFELWAIYCMFALHFCIFCTKIILWKIALIWASKDSTIVFLVYMVVIFKLLKEQIFATNFDFTSFREAHFELLLHC